MLGRVTVDDLSRRFEVSAQTIRKDLNELCERRSLTRVHGGAIISSGVENLAYEARRFVAADEKRAIGIAAAALIPNGSSLFINIGTTTEAVARRLDRHRGLMVISNNLNVIDILEPFPEVDAIVAGGRVRKKDRAVVGPLAMAFIDNFKVDYAVIGASAIDADGALLDYDIDEVQVSQTIIRNARCVLLVADSSKVGRAAPVRIGHFSDIDLFVTDALKDESLRAICERHEVTVIEAGSGEP
jgi:DeoR family glycerol-3-phosphate regulon repressor